MTDEHNTDDIEVITDPELNKYLDDLAERVGGGWDHRVLRRAHTIGEEIEYDYSIYEVYYTKCGEPTSHTETPVDPHGQTIAELTWSLSKYIEALSKPVLEYDTLKEIK